MSEKTCWICKRTEEELKKFEGYEDFLKNRWMTGMDYGGLFICPICRSLLYQVTYQDEEDYDLVNRIIEVFEEQILPRLKIKQSFTLELEETEDKTDE